MTGGALAGQTVLVIGGSSGIGLETARLARREGAEVVLTGRDPERLRRAAADVGAQRTAAFDATDFDRLERFFAELPAPLDHVMVTAGSPYYAPLAEMDFARARRDIDAHLWLPLYVARYAVGRVRPGGTLLFLSGTGGRRTAVGLSLVSTITAGLPALTKSLASRSPRSGSTSSRRASSTRPCPRCCSATSSSSVASSSARRCRSGGWSDRRTSPRCPCTS